MAGPASKPRALILEDDPAFRHGLVRLVEGLGCEVDAAETVAEALGKLDSQPVCLILDLNLPDGHGTRVLERVRSENLPVKVAVLSGTDDHDLLAEVQRLRPDVLLKKPPEWETLVAWLQDAARAG